MILYLTSVGIDLIAHTKLYNCTCFLSKQNVFTHSLIKWYHVSMISLWFTDAEENTFILSQMFVPICDITVGGLIKWKINEAYVKIIAFFNHCRSTINLWKQVMNNSVFFLLIINKLLSVCDTSHFLRNFYKKWSYFTNHWYKFKSNHEVKLNISWVIYMALDLEIHVPSVTPMSRPWQIFLLVFSNVNYIPHKRCFTI